MWSIGCVLPRWRTSAADARPGKLGRISAIVQPPYGAAAGCPGAGAGKCSHLRDAGEGHIINTASEAGLVTSAVLGMYSATKHAVVGLTESLFRELDGTGVGVHCLCPNLVKTHIFESERSRDDGVNPTASQTATIAPLREAISAMGISPNQVASDIIDALRANKFWILTHELSLKAASVRFADLEAGRNPTSPYAGIEGLEGLDDFG